MINVMSNNEMRKQATEQVKGRIQWDELCRMALHNKAEREPIQAEMLEAHRARAAGEDAMSAARYSYLRHLLKRLTIEKAVLVAKKERIEGRVSDKVKSSFKFII